MFRNGILFNHKRSKNKVRRNIPASELNILLLCRFFMTIAKCMSRPC